MQWEPSSMRRTVMRKLIVAFCNFMNARIIARKAETVVGSPTGNQLLLRCLGVSTLA